MQRIDLTGSKFGFLTVLADKGTNKHQNAIFECICSCGNKKIIPSANLRSGRTKSCGCESSRTRIGLLNLSHGLANKRFYNIYMTLKARCENPKSHKYSRYGGRGIKNLWSSFEEFRKDMHRSYLQHVEEFGEKQTTIDRINNNGHYCRSNCRWATYKQQAQANTGVFKKGLVPWNKK